MNAPTGLSRRAVLATGAAAVVGVAASPAFSDIGNPDAKLFEAFDELNAAVDKFTVDEVRHEAVWQRLCETRPELDKYETFTGMSEDEYRRRHDALFKGITSVSPVGRVYFEFWEEFARERGIDPFMENPPRSHYAPIAIFPEWRHALKKAGLEDHPHATGYWKFWEDLEKTEPELFADPPNVFLSLPDYRYRWEDSIKEEIGIPQAEYGEYIKQGIQTLRAEQKRREEEAEVKTAAAFTKMCDRQNAFLKANGALSVPEIDQAHDRLWDLRRDIADIPAQTSAGLALKTELLQEVMHSPWGEIKGALMASITTDAKRIGGAT